MGMITNLIDRMFKASWERAQRAEKVSRAYAPAISTEDNLMAAKTFTVREALNGKYIEFRRFKYNPHGPNEHEQCVYIVKDDETLLDAISVVLVLMDKEN